MRDPTPCRRAAYHLTREDPSTEGWVGSTKGRHVLAVYIFSFFVGLVLGAALFYFVNKRKQRGQRPKDSSEKGREILGSSTTPQSPSSTSLMSEGLRRTEKRNGTTSTTTTTTLLSNHGNGSHQGNSHSSSLNNSNPSNGLYANCNVSGSGLKLSSEILAPDRLDGRTRIGVRSEVREGESGEGDELDKGLEDGLGEGLDRLEDYKHFPVLSNYSNAVPIRASAPLAKCEESSI